MHAYAATATPGRALPEGTRASPEHTWAKDNVRPLRRASRLPGGTVYTKDQYTLPIHYLLSSI
jgi:hypothetical protein